MGRRWVRTRREGRTMDLRLRKSFKLPPGPTARCSKTSVGYWDAGKVRKVTKRPRGGLQPTANLPSTGFRYSANGTAKRLRRRRPDGSFVCWPGANQDTHSCSIGFDTEQAHHATAQQ
jgi:hypothetical protein